jgi:hypothetical protein
VWPFNQYYARSHNDDIVTQLQNRYPEQESSQMSAEESSPLEGTGRDDPERSMRMKLVIIGVALLFILAAYAYVGTRDRSLDIDTAALISQQQEDGLVCCSVSYEAAGETYLLVVTRELEGEFRRVVFRIMEFDDDGSPSEINAIGSPFDGLLPTRFSVVDQTAYVPLYGADEAGVWQIDLSDPAWPEDAGFTPTAGGITRQLATSGDLLAIHHTDEIVLLDIADRRDPQALARLEQPESGVVSMKVVDAMLYVNDAVSNEFRIYDLSDPEAPAQRAIHRNPDGPDEFEFDFGVEDAADRLDQSALASRYLDFAVAGDLVYLAASELGLRVLDLSQPGSPEIVTDLELPDRAVRVVQQGDRLFVLGASEGNVDELSYAIHTIDIADPGAPQLVDTINGVLAEPGIQGLTAVEQRLVLNLFESILVFDVSE